MIVHEVTERHVELRLDPAIYGEAVVFKCFYWYGNAFEVTITKGEADGWFVVTLVPLRPPLSGPELQTLLSRVRRDLVDFKTRDIVARETRAIRELLVAKAFAASDELDEPPLGSVADLGGMEPGESAHAVA